MDLLSELLDFWWQPSLLICLVLLIRVVCKKYLNAKTRYKLWLLPLLRILFPIRFLPGPDMHLLSSYNTSLGSSMPYDPATSITITNGWIHDTLSLKSFILFVYILICMVLLVFTIVKNHRSLQRLKWNRKPLPYFDAKLVYESDAIEGALTYGIGKRAAIYIPSSFLKTKSTVELDFILAHEYGHLKQKDFIWNILRISILIFAWYHPLIWLAVILSRHDAELAADAFTVEVFGKSMRQDYAKVLIGQDSLDRLSLSSAFAMDLGFSSPYSTLKKRIEHLYQNGQHSKKARLYKHMTQALLLPILLAGLYLSFSYGELGATQFKLLDGQQEEGIVEETTYQFGFVDEFYPLEPTSETTVTYEKEAYLTDQYGNISGSIVIE